jgi:hypothetical protein
MSRERQCPKCQSAMEHHPEDPDVGIIGAYVCTGCDQSDPDHDDYADDHEFW